jgi:4-amino-4-deoxy-L-arabinose transferase-like glycosyltransferase
LQSTTRRASALFFACLLFHLAGTWSIPLIDRDEPRFAEASREMGERHDLVVPFFNGDYRFDKPPLTYWAQLTSYQIFGTNDFAARFPSAVAAAATALVLFFWGRRLGGGDRPGWYGAVIFTLAFQVVEHAKAAVADMWLVLFVTLAHWAAFEMLGLAPPRATIAEEDLNRHPARNWWWVLYISLAFAFLAKGPIGWTPLLTIAAMTFVMKIPPQRFAFVRGTLLTLAMVALWGVPALIRTHGEFFRIGIGRHVIERSFGAIGGHGASSLGIYLLLLPFYFVTVFLTFFPWSLKLPWLTTKIWRRRDAVDSYFIAGTLVIFAIFTLVNTRLVHYALPAFPLMALLLARWLAKENSEGFVRRCALVMVPIYLVCALALASFTERISPARELFAKAQADLRPEMKFAAVDFTEPSVVWYFRSRISAFMQTVPPAGAQAFMSEQGPRFVILTGASARELFPNIPPTWKTFSAEGFNLAKGRRVDLTLLLKPE